MPPSVNDSLCQPALERRFSAGAEAWMRLGAMRLIAFCCVLFLVAGPVSGETGLVERVMLKLQVMEFEFARAESDVPFLPALNASFKVYGKTEFAQFEGLPAADDEAEFRTRVASAYAAAPLYIGRRGFALTVPYVSRTRFHFTRGDRADEDVTSVYLPVGGAWQTESGRQWGAFVMPAGYSPLSGEGDWAWSGMGGMMGRTFSGRNLVWYYGLVYDHAFSDGYYLPYLGFTYQMDPTWAFSMVAPWPGINYAPSDSFFMRVGVSPSGATWAVDEDQAMTSLGGWDLGLWANWRLSKTLWLSAGSGVSGLRNLRISTSGEVDYDQDIDREPWVSVSLSIRPQ